LVETPRKHLCKNNRCQGLE